MLLWRDSAAMRRSQFRIDCVSALTSDDRRSEAEPFSIASTRKAALVACVR